jgi:RimJ/RimL family protein N-acetyltransferase
LFLEKGLGPILQSKRLVIKPLLLDDYGNAGNAYRNSADFIVRINGHAPDEINEAFVEDEAREAEEHAAQYCGIFLLKGGKLVGIATFEPGNHGGDKRTAWIALLLISELFQEKGYGAETYKTLEHYIFSEPEVDRIELGVLPGNDKGKGFWEAMGYRVVEPGLTPSSVIKMRKTRS